MSANEKMIEDDAERAELEPEIFYYNNILETEIIENIATRPEFYYDDNHPFNSGVFVSDIKLSAEAFEQFKRFAKKKPWVSRTQTSSQYRRTPSQYIKRRFKKWLGKGLMREHIIAVQPNLVVAYAAEIYRHPERAVEGLGTRPHTRPPDAPIPVSQKPAADLTEEERARRNASARARTRAYRLRLRNIGNG